MAGKILIFGATGAVGSSLAKLLKDNSTDTHLIGKNEEEISKLSEQTGGSYTVADVTDPSFVEKVDGDIKDKDIAGIAYCVGSIDLKPLKNSKKEDFKKCLDLNFFPVIEIIKSLQDSLKKNNGSIVLFSTVAVQKGFTNHAIIASAKGAIEGLTVSLAAEFAPNIRVNCIAPTLTNSKMSQNILKSKLMAEGIAKSHPMKRVGKPEDVASMGKFLLTDESPFITGQIIGVDGGKSTLN